MEIPPSNSAIPWQASWRNRLGRLGRLVRKELLEILRDRRTVLTLLLMPLLLYPLLSIAFQQFFLAHRPGLKKTEVFTLGFPEENQETLGPKLNRLNDYLLLGEALSLLAEKAPGGTPAAPRERIQVDINQDNVSSDLETDVQLGKFDLGVRLKKHEIRQDILSVELIYNVGSPTSRAALEYVERRLAAVNFRGFSLTNLKFFLDSLEKKPQASPRGFSLTRIAVLPPEGSGLATLSALIPLILILMTITGAVYPAIDLTAGERERGTLEILVAAPVPRLGLLFAKYVTVLTVAVLTALINLVMMIGTLFFSGLGGVLFRDIGLTPWMIVQLFGLLLLFAAFFSAVLLTLTSFARSFKEAQAYLIPLMLVSLGPGVIGLFPWLKLEGLLTVAPLVNIVLLGRDLFRGEADVAVSAVVVLSTALYALAALAVAARIFGSESVLYSEQLNWGDLFRRPETAQAAPTVTAALLCLALMFPAWFVLRGLVRFLGLPPPTLLVLVPLASAVLFAGFPLLSAALGRVRFTSGFQWRLVPLPLYLGGLVLGLSLWPLVLQLLTFLKQLSGSEANLEQWSEILGVLYQARQIPLVWQLTAFVIPALVEELFFRGYLFSALRARTGPAATILISALLFAIFHVITEAFGLERFPPSFLLGLVLGWVCWKTGSVLPGMLLHGLHNSLLLLFGQSGLPLAVRVAAAGAAGGSLPLGEPTLPWTWVAAAAVGAAVGLAVIAWWGTRTSEGEFQANSMDPVPVAGERGASAP